MTREEATQWLKHINITDFGWDDYAMQDSQKEIRERCEQSIREAIDMAIEALSADTVSREEYEEVKAYMDTLVDAFIEDGEELAESVKVVRCKDCRWFKQDSSPVGYGYCDGRMVGREVDYNDYCSFGELADKTKYPATYNTNTKCGGCVHLDELGRCLNFMLAKDDRSCWRGSWENNNGELAEQTEPSAEPIERISDNTIVVKYADYEDIGRIILTNGDIFCKMFYEDARQNDDSDYDSLVPDEYKTDPSDLISRADAIDCCEDGLLFEEIIHRIEELPSADAESDDLIIKGAKGIQDGLYNIKDGKLFMYKANGGTVRTYPIVPPADRPIADKCDDCLYEDSDKSLFPCTYCKRNHFDKYEKDESNNITESANDANETENDVIDSDTTSKERLIHSVFESAKQFTSADRPTEDYSDLPDIPRAYYERIVGNMSHEINMLKEQLESADAVQGEWIEREDWNGDYYYDCSVCGESFVLFDGTPSMNLYHFCPNCGARMKGGDDE